MKNNIENLIESKITVFEENAKNNLAFSAKDVERLKLVVLNLAKSAKLDESELTNYLSRINLLENVAVSDDKFVKEVSPTSLSMRASNKDKIIANAASDKTKKKWAVRGIILAVATASLITACANSKTKKEAVEPATEVVMETEMLKEEPITYTDMSEEIKLFADNTVVSADDSLTSGINLSMNEILSEEDKLTYAKVLTQYRIMANIDDFTKLQYAEMFAEKADPTEDLIENFFEYNTMIKKHLITVSSSNVLDYNNLYTDANDAKVLNESERLIANINDATSSDEKLTAAKAWYSYTVNILTSTEGNIALSSQALDTLITHSEAYDELTRSNYAKVQGAHIDDELEHYFNISKDACIGVTNDANINVEETNIENLKSEFRISFKEKAEEAYQNGLSERELQLSLGKELNSYNSYDNIVEYVRNNIDLSKYVAVSKDAYIEKQKEEKGLNAPAQKSKHDSGVSDGQGGVIDSSQFDQYGINPNDPNAKAELEQAVQKEDEQKSEDSKQVTDQNGTTVQGTSEDYATGFQTGYADAQSGKPNSPSGNPSFNLGYSNGYGRGLDDLANVPVQEPTTEYQPTNGEEQSTESNITTYNYTEPAPSTESTPTNGDTTIPAGSTTTFVPVEDGAESSTESEVTTEDYTTSYYISQLEALRDEALAATTVDYIEEESTKSL